MSALAQAATSNANVESIVKWSIALLVALIVGVLLISRIRRWLTRDDESTPIGSGGGFTLSDLREMHRSGQISDAEYERCRARITAITRRAIDKKMPGQTDKSTSDDASPLQSPPDNPSPPAV